MNMQNILAQAQKMQKEINKKYQEIENTVYIGKSEWVQISIKGDHTIQKFEILYEGDLNEEKETLSDMIMIAFNDAEKKLQTDAENKLGSYGKFGGMI